jgi:hypothetical protein
VALCNDQVARVECLNVMRFELTTRIATITSEVEEY